MQGSAGIRFDLIISAESVCVGLPRMKIGEAEAASFGLVLGLRREIAQQASVDVLF